MTAPLPPDDIPPDVAPWPDGPPPPPLTWHVGGAGTAPGRTEATSHDVRVEPDPQELEDRRRVLRTIILSLAVGSVLFRLLRATHQEHGALVFVGIPTILAVIIANSAPAKTITGTIMRVTTLALLMAAIVFGEATVCILFAAPLLYLVGYIIGVIAEAVAARNRPKQLYVFVLFFIPLSLEGVIPGTGFERNASVTVEREIVATAAEVRATLAAPMDFRRELPPFLRLGFPTPGAVSGDGLRVGDRRTIAFSHGHHPGTLALQVTSASLRDDGGAVVFTRVSDDSYITHWLSWHGARVEWQELSPGRTRVRWTLDYRRRLDPAWYFAPVEHHGVRVAAGYLLETLTMPHARPGAAAPSAHR